MEPLFTRRFWRRVAITLTVSGFLAYLVDDAELVMLCILTAVGALCLPTRED